MPTRFLPQETGFFFSLSLPRVILRAIAKNPFGAPAMKTPTRRQFLTSTVAAGAAVSLGTAGSSAIEPIHRNGKSHIRLSIAAYSYRKYLDLRTRPKPSMTLDD